MDIRLIIFSLVSLITIGSASIVAFSRNLMYSAFALLGVFAGIAGLFIMLSADFVAIIQLVVYIGGILILILFAVMLTTKIETKTGKRNLINKGMAPAAAGVTTLVLGALLIKTLTQNNWLKIGDVTFVPTTHLIGNKLLSEYLLPFEIISILLVLVLVGSVVIGRRIAK